VLCLLVHAFAIAFYLLAPTGSLQYQLLLVCVTVAVGSHGWSRTQGNFETATRAVRSEGECSPVAYWDALS
jgi:hypothetical protein